MTNLAPRYPPSFVFVLGFVGDYVKSEFVVFLNRVHYGSIPKLCDTCRNRMTSTKEIYVRSLKCESLDPCLKD